MKAKLQFSKRLWLFEPVLCICALALCWTSLKSMQATIETTQVGMILITALYGAVIVVRQLKRVRAERNIEDLLWQEVDRSQNSMAGTNDKQILRNGLTHAISLIHQSRSAGGGGASALHELPWYLVLGSPGAGKTSLLNRSGLSVSKAASSSGSETGDAQQCDWYFSPDAVLIDTASRYLKDDQASNDFSDFLRLLTKHRRKPAINGVVLVVSVPEILSATNEARGVLAEHLAARIAQYANSLGASPPIYLVLSKCDQLSGFAAAFSGLDLSERQQPLGMTFASRDISQLGARKLFEEKFAGLTGSVHQHVDSLIVSRGGVADDQLMQFPHDFAELSGSLISFFVRLEQATQARFPSALRGVYFTSAVQTRNPLPPLNTAALAERFALLPDETQVEEVSEEIPISTNGYFINDLFKKIIFPDLNLSLTYSHANRRRSWTPILIGVAAALGLGFVGWSGFEFRKDRLWLVTLGHEMQLLDQASDRDQQFRKGMPLEMLRHHLVQIEQQNSQGILKQIRGGLYNIGAAAEFLQAAYLQQLTTQALEPISKYLQVQLGGLDDLKQTLKSPAGLPINPTAVRANLRGGADAELFDNTEAVAALGLSEEVLGRLDEGQIASVAEAYDALKLYLILTLPNAHPDAAFVAKTLPGVWAKAAAAEGQKLPEKLIANNVSMYVRFLNSQQAPDLRRNDPLVAQARQSMKSLMIASSVVDREYLRLQLESARQFPSLNLGDLIPLEGRSQLVSTESVPAFYTRQGWEKFFKPELAKLLAGTLSHEIDWVLDGEGNNGIVQKANFTRDLMTRYKADYAGAWFRMLEGTSIRRPADMDSVSQQLTQLSDVKNSPLKKLLAAVNYNTSWDMTSRPETGNESNTDTTVLIAVKGALKLGGNSVETPSVPTINDGSLSHSFDAVSRLFAADNPEGVDSTIMDRYLGALRKIKVRLTNIQRSQDPGRNSKLLISETLEGQPSEVTTLRNYVETSIDTSKGELSASLQRLFNAPLQYTWQALRDPAGQQIAKAWGQQIAKPWQQIMAHRYPIARTSRNEASVKDLQRFIHPESGLLPAFKRNEIGSLADGEGLGLASNAKVSPLVSAKMIDGIAKAAALGQVIASLSDSENGFEIMLEPASNYTDIILTLDGQVLHYRNGKSTWSRFVWPGTTLAPGARLDAVTLAGERVTLFDFPGRWGLMKMNDSARVSELDQVQQRFTWVAASGPVSLTVRNYGGVKLTDLAGVKSLGSLNDIGRAE